MTEVPDPSELVPGDALRVVDEARAVAHGHWNAAKVKDSAFRTQLIDTGRRGRPAGRYSLCEFYYRTCIKDAKAGRCSGS